MLLGYTCSSEEFEASDLVFLLVEIIGDAGLERLIFDRVIGVAADEHDGKRKAACLHQADETEPVPAGKPIIHQTHVEGRFGEQAQAGFDRSGPLHHETGLHRARQQVERERVVFLVVLDHEDADHWLDLRPEMIRPHHAQVAARTAGLPFVRSRRFAECPTVVRGSRSDIVSFGHDRPQPE